jgi:hypothetical protein
MHDMLGVGSDAHPIYAAAIAATLFINLFQ